MNLPSILVINPNTTASVTEQVARAAAPICAGLAQVHTATAPWGAPYISDEASYAVGAHAGLETWARFIHAGGRPDAVLLACFGDPGLLALRDSSAAPVTGLAEAALLEAAERGRFAIVTGGVHWPPMLQRLCRDLGVAHALAGVEVVPATGAELAQDPERAHVLIAQACREAHRRYAPETLILGGAALAGMVQRLQPELGLPLIDSVEAGVRRALRLAQQAPDLGKRNGFRIRWQGLGDAMVALGPN